ncbi:MAG: tetratricopeptide repeat protein [Lachnospiraceae bacterium]|nr:tetratricopeptide repeat protein [Lachnospiraceae bacterium]
MSLHKILIIFLLTMLVNVASSCSFGERNEFTNLGFEALEARDYEAALIAFGSAEEALEDMRLLYRGRGLALMGLLQYEEALSAFEKALSFSNGIPALVDFDINYYMAAAFYITGQKERAIETYDAILTLREKDGDAYFLRGAIRAEQGLIQEARSDFDQALSLNTGNSDRLIDIYQILAGNGYHGVGEEYLRDAMEQNAGDMNNFEKGRISFYLSDYENARAYLEKARDFNYEAVLFLGMTYEVLADYNYAVSVYIDYIDRGNESPQIYNQLGICRINMNDYENALLAFLAGMAIEDNDILQTLRFNEIVANQFLGDFGRAAVLMDGYLSLYPDDKVAERENYFLRTR